jgi:glycosyltransferase involved in cell wall biosynthesis
VLVITYNHEQYVQQSLDSVMMQKADFDFEVVVADDHSQDSTLELLKEYEANNPHVRILPTEKHLGITQNYKRGFEACSGDYVAVLEGDDYWITPHKLEVLSDLLQRYPECTLCFHRTIRLDEEFGLASVHPEFRDGATPDFFTARQLVSSNVIGGLSTCMYRRNVISRLDPGLWSLKFREWPFNIVMAREGLIGYVPEVMSIYRAHPGGIWSRKTAAERRTMLLEVIEPYNEYLKFEFNAEFQTLKRIYLADPGEPAEGARSVATGPTGVGRGSIYRRLARRAKPFVPPIFVTLVRGVFERARDFRRNRRH